MFKELTRNKKKIIVIPLAIFVSVAIIAGGFYHNTTKAAAHSSLPGIEGIVNNNSPSSPFVIVELVPEKQNARIGYLIANEEPVINGESILDMPSKEERTEKMTNAIAIPARLSEAVSYTSYAETSTGDTKTLDIHGHFEPCSDSNADYFLDAGTQPYILADDTTDSTLTRYTRTFTFSTVTDGTGNCGLVLSQTPGSEINISGENGYNSQFFHSKEFKLLDDATEIYLAQEGDLVFEISGENLAFCGKIEKDVSDENKLKIKQQSNATYLPDTINIADYRIVSITDADDDTSYYVSQIQSITGGPFIYNTEYREDVNGRYIQNIVEYKYKDGVNPPTYSFITNFSDKSVDTASFSGGFTNKEWFKQYVFDLAPEECNAFSIDVVTLTPSELNSFDLGQADLLYIAGGKYSSDLSEEKAKAIVNSVKGNSFPVILNKSAANETTGNVDKLSAALMQNNFSDVIMDNWNNDDFLINLQSTKKSSDVNLPYSFVNGTVFVYDDGLSNLISNDFNSAYSTEKVEYGFSNVLNEIKTENLYRKMSGKEESEYLSTEISDARVIRYIINYGDNRSVVKSTLSVLDLEPSNGFSELYTDEQLRHPYNNNSIVNLSEVPEREVMTKEWITGTVALQFSSNQDEINLVGMSTKEFIGDLQDPCEVYDMIYIGLDTSIMNTDIIDNKKTTNTIYNDAGMNGLVYSHVGDKVNQGDLRLSGNDITENKLNQLKNYIKTGYAVVFADGFYNKHEDGTYTINTGHIDSSSNMYKLAEFSIAYMGKNVNTRTGLEETTTETEEFTKYLSLSKMSLSYSSDNLPLSYTKEDGITHQYLSMNDNGKYTLNYKVKLNDDSAEGNSSSYDCKLYIDYDGDGRYEDNERIDGVSVSTEDGTNQGIDGGTYHLSAGSTYNISCDTPTGYTGYLTWKLEFIQNGSESLIRRAIYGDAAVPIASKPIIKVLQIYNMDDLNVENSQLTSLYSSIDYEVDVDRLPASDYLKLASSQIEYLEQYDVVVLGFNSAVNATQTQCESGVKALRQYALEGKSLLFINTLNEYANDDNTNWQYYCEKYLRDVQGTDRFGKTGVINELTYDSLYDNQKLRDSDKDNTALSNAYLMKNGSGYGENSRVAANNFSMNLIEKASITNNNFGSISNYPFDILSDTFTAQNTYPQCYQLNMDTIWNDDKSDDITVWYTISGQEGTDDNYFKSVYKDARNNYYVYNKANVWYTGFCDVSSTSELERQLFVNTLIAAYRSGSHVPYVVYKESKWETSTDISNMYLPYDPAADDELGSFINENVTVNFKTVNTNFLDNTKAINAEYYVKADDASYDLKVGAQYYKKISPVSISQIAADGTVTAANSSQLQNGGMYTMQINTNDLGMRDTNGVRDGRSAELYIRLSCDSFKASPMDAKSSKESFSKLSIICTKLFDLE